MNFCPFDLVYKIGKFLPFKLLLCVLKETQRAHKVYHGVVHTAKLYPNAYFIIVLIGTIKGKHLAIWIYVFTLCFVSSLFLNKVVNRHQKRRRVREKTV